jgi:two-component system, chemotaxis family, CheB/CheR fusion protein
MVTIESSPTTAAVAAAPSRSDLYIVGIGASAGGLEALVSFFDNLPKDTGMAFVVVQHLSPDFKSLMDELLARHTELPIWLVEDGMAVEADHVYLIPPKKEMIISGGRLLLSERDRQQELTLPIDVFFRSLAHDCGRLAVAIVLSGGGSDGSRGIRDVHEAGGLVIVQDVESAQFNGMPRTAREAGVAHWVMPPQEMPRILLDHARTGGMDPSARKDEPEASTSPEGLTAVYRMLQDVFGIDFTHYKPSTITRRIERRLRLARDEDIEEYIGRLKRDRGELDVLYRDLLIGVTRFFRNEEAFTVLEQRVLPELLGQGSRDAPFRVWVAACATGEEAYSLAILLHELTARLRTRPFKIFATDVHHGSLEVAGRGLYDEDAVANVSPERLERYFLRSGRSYQLVPDIRQMIVFAQHNVIKDAPFTRVDLVSCRNMLIYLQPPVQQKVLSLFHFALNRGGIVFLGPSESPGPLASNFEPVDRHWRIFRKYSDVRIRVDVGLPLTRTVETRPGPIPVQGPLGRYSLAQLLGTYDSLLEDFMPPSLLVNEHYELVHAFAGASRFLKPRDGRQGLDVRDLVDDALKMVLGGGLQRALKASSPIVFRGVRIRTDVEEEVYKVTVRRILPRSAGAPHLLIAFEALEGVPPRAVASETEINIEQVSREQLGVLEAELSYTKENLQAAIEEHESSNEELQASNEELLASNEELQSTNEELQSVNEELYTVNAEYQRKINELTQLTNDMDNLLSSTDVGTIFLDKTLRIRKFTPQIAESFNLLPQDVGRSIETFTNTMDHPELAQDARRVLAKGEPVERELRDQRGRSFFLRILPYRAKGMIEGVVITLIDVSSLKAAEDALFHERYLLNSLLFSVPDAIYFRDARGRFIRANHAMALRLGLTDPVEAVGKTPFELPDQEAALALHRQDEEVLRTGSAQHYKLEKRTRPGRAEEWDLVTRLPLTDRSSGIVGIIGIFRDVTEQKRAEEKIQEAVRRRDEFLAMLSHELRNPLSAVVAATGLLKGSDAAVERQGRLVEILDRQSQQMARLLDDLLDASRVTQNKIELRKQRLDLRTVVKDAADATRTLMDSNGLHFTLEVDPRPLYVDGDSARLQQIHVNLLTNAAKYTPSGGHVMVEAKHQDGQAIISVKDDGVGIPKEMLGAVFDLFVQSRRTLDRAQGGIGVGLTLTRSLVEMHGGTVTAHSDGQGKGSLFVVRLPLASAPADEEESVRTRPRVRLANGSRVVIVEDNVDSREMLCELLKQAGFECLSAGDGVTGLALIDNAAPDVAIVDVGLPGMDGFEIAQRIRREPRHARIFLIALTGYGQRSDRANAFNAGFDEHLVKPVRAEQLVWLLTKIEDENEGTLDGAGSALHKRDEVST